MIQPNPIFWRMGMELPEWICLTEGISQKCEEPMRISILQGLWNVESAKRMLPGISSALTSTWWLEEVKYRFLLLLNMTWIDKNSNVLLVISRNTWSWSRNLPGLFQKQTILFLNSQSTANILRNEIGLRTCIEYRITCMRYTTRIIYLNRKCLQ